MRCAAAAFYPHLINCSPPSEGRSLRKRVSESLGWIYRPCIAPEEESGPRLSRARQCVASRRLVWSPSPFRPALPPCPSLGRGPELAKFREARALLSRQCRRTPHPPPGKVSAWASWNFANESPKTMKIAPPNSTNHSVLATTGEAGEHARWIELLTRAH